jgi:5-methylcytosine-specific restriction endonuclease McrA
VLGTTAIASALHFKNSLQASQDKLHDVVAFERSALNHLVYSSDDNAANNKPFKGFHGKTKLFASTLARLFCLASNFQASYAQLQLSDILREAVQVFSNAFNLCDNSYLLIANGNHHPACGQQHTSRHRSSDVRKLCLPGTHLLGVFHVYCLILICCKNGQGLFMLKESKNSMGGRNGPNDLLHSLVELRPAEAKRRFRKSIFEDYPLRGPLGQPACAYCGKWHEKLTLDHLVPKSKGGPHYAKWNLVPACFSCNSSKSSSSIFQWWRPMNFWAEERERVLLAWIYANSFISAYTSESDYEEWLEKVKNDVPSREKLLINLREIPAGTGLLLPARQYCH